MKRTHITLSVLLVIVLMLTGCSGLTLGMNSISTVTNAPGTTSTDVPQLDTNTPAAPAANFHSVTLADFQSTLEGVYTRVNPSVVNLRVVQKQKASTSQLPGIPGFELPDLPFQSPQQDAPEEYRQEGLGSGFVWDKQGHIVTNNHVIEGADEVTVTFADGSSVEGKVVGADPDSDLAVVKVEIAKDMLQPVQLADSTQAKVGQVSIAIGNPFGLEGTMTFGIISGLGRSLPVDSGENITSGAYTIPDIIQTDAPINPGNSGGVLVNIDGKVLGVTTAIESPVRANAGIGFVVPSVIVQKVIPALIKDGSYDHTWLGISGMTLNKELNKAMNLKPEQRGILVLEVTPASPADKAGIRGSDRNLEINRQTVLVGGDILTAIDKQPIKEFDDLTAYLARNTEVGQKVTLTFLRSGKEQTTDVTLAARPLLNETPEPEIKEADQKGNVWLGIQGISVSPAIAKAMNLPEDQKGVLIEQVEQSSPADTAGLRGSFKPLTLGGERILVGGDIITAMDGKAINSMDDLKTALKSLKP